ncbi:MAG TPA: outer membrane lipoprotein carrier protein LolA [Bryobacteraceae bacterium]|nr:outer membrane lipoprotein carrier protein LolA [Bryobacteraceae bacterium]
MGPAPRNLRLHILHPVRVKRYVTRFPLWVSLAVLPLQAASPDLTVILKGVEQRYNHAKTLQVQYNETYTVQGQARKSETGTLTLRKPGRMRWDYTAPAGKLFLSDGKDVYLYTPESHRVEKEPLKASEDMRAPMAFLLGKLDFSKEFRNFELKPEGTGFVVTARAKSDKLPYEKVEMLVTPDYEIRRLVVNGQDGSILTFLFDQEKLNPAVNDAQFKFQLPAGAQLVTAEMNQ